MRILQLHADWVEYEPIEKEIKQAEEIKKGKHKLEDILVLLTAVEQNDDKTIAQKAIEGATEFLKQLKIKKVLIYPYAHLSSNLAKPTAAFEILTLMEKFAKDAKLEVYRAPFGWNKQFAISVKGHPLAEQSRTYTAATLKEKTSKPALGKTKVEETLPDTDHRIIGKQLDLYSFHPSGPGMVFWHEKGNMIRNTLIQFLRNEYVKQDYKEILTPMILNKNIWEISGHWDHYKDNMFFTTVEDMDFAVKPMNCPGAIMVFKTSSKSYRDLPLRLAEFGWDHRNELSGVLSGLFRVRAFVQDDVHIFATPEQAVSEIGKVIDFIDYVYKIFGFDYHVELSTRPEGAMANKEIWEIAEKALKDALEKKKMKYKLNPGDGAFYGPKIDFHIKDSMGRSWQLGTVQADFVMPERFDVQYVGEDGKGHRPVIIHRAVFGSLERFIGILVEHYQGKFPAWLSPLQVRVVPMSDKNVKYAQEVLEKLRGNGIRADIDAEQKTMQNKIREAQLQKINYVLVIGQKEEDAGTVAVRNREGKVEYGIKTEDFANRIYDEIKSFK
ncbi:threonine--tRNA ligase [archaeon]|nr:MAG: threonine--tRNA ligase [archaeon]